MLGAETSLFRPVTRSFVFDVADRQPKQLDDRVIVREVAAVLGHLPQLVVERLDRVGRIDHAPQFGREREEGREPLPRVTEYLAGRGAAPAQLGRLEDGELGRRCLGVRGLTDRLQRGGDGLTVGGRRRTASQRGSSGPRRLTRSLPARPVSDCFGEACQAIAADDQYIPGTPRLASSAQTAAQNLVPSFTCTQMPSTCLTPPMSIPMTRWAALLRTCPPSRTLTTIASRKITG